MLAVRPVWLCIPTRLIGWRSGNDSFVRLGQFNRMRIDVFGYDQVFGDVMGRNNPAYHRVMEKVASVHVHMHLRAARLRGEKREYWRKALPLTVRHYWRYPNFWLKSFPLFLVPSIAVQAARWGYRRTLKPASQRSQ
jgi:abequosyltransferase